MWQLRPDEELIYLWEDVANEYRRMFGAQPFNLSHWDTLWDPPVFERLRLTSGDIIRYAYSYTMNDADELIEKLGFDSDVRTALVTPNGTLSMQALISYARDVWEVAALDVLCPHYVVLDRQAWRAGVELRHHYMRRERGGYRLPVEILRRPEARAVWLTNPVFSASVYLDAEDVGELSAFLDRGGIVIADESLSLPGRELGRDLGESPRFWGIYTPQKGLGTNGLKFSLAVAPAEAWKYLEIWSDAFAGSLNATARIAIQHYLGPTFETLERWFRDETQRAWDGVRRLVSEYPGFVLDARAEGHFVMCYAPEIPAERPRDPAFARELVNRSGATLITGLRSHYDPALGLCFRLNLARRGTSFDAALRRLLAVLSELSGG